MSVRRRVEDAHLLFANGRGDGALLSACAALSATSRKRYPESLGMCDREAFTQFLGEEIPVVSRGFMTTCKVFCPGADSKYYPDSVMPFQDVIYKFIRCSLAHEGVIGQNVEFIDNGQLSVTIENTRLILGSAVVDGLLAVPRFAPENAHEFPDVAEMPREVAGWHMFGKLRDNHVEYLLRRQARLEAALSLRL